MSPRIPSTLAALLAVAVAASGLTAAPVRAVALEGEGGPVTRSSRSLRPTSSRSPPPRRSSRARSGGRASSSTRRTTLAEDLVGDADHRRRLDGDDPQHLRRADRPGRAQHDRRASRQHPAPAGHRRRGRHGRHASDQTIVVPLGGILPVDATTTIRVSFHALLRNNLSGSNWLFTTANGIIDLYRWLPWVSRRIAFDRPNHGDPFETPSSRYVRVTIAPRGRWLVWPRPATAPSVSADGLTQTFEATNVRDFTVTAATDYRTRSRVGRRHDRPGLLPAGRAWRGDARRRRRRASTPRAAARAVSVPDVQGRPVGRGYGMESPGLIWIPTGVAPSTFATWPPTRRPTSGSTGSSAATRPNEPFTDEAAADFAARYVLGLERGSRCATATARPLDLRLLRALLLRDRLHPGRQPARRRAPDDGLDRFWAALRGYVAATATGSRRPRRSSRRSTRRRRSTSAGPCSRRGSRGSTERTCAGSGRLRSALRAASSSDRLRCPHQHFRGREVLKGSVVSDRRCPDRDPRSL